ncbi:nicotinamide/nicotinic acid mononucleotide adenylyltransferase 3 [Culicoides brevitarsis]|uniref:nicotinamide/nicotinic acid mononucleotide adenylyltransferase 3 n=1 Tax=Culicoides brevitarsis TaxID=469753 RepID=UPI00307C033E
MSSKTNKIFLIACGSFSPPTPMHFRMFELARDHFQALGYTVLGGIISPVHDSYPKVDLAPAKHRLAMVKLGLQTSDWIRLSDWETLQAEWTRTRQVLQYHQNYINSFLVDNNKGNNNSGYIPSWLPLNLLKNCGAEHVQVKLLCGADLLESFATPGLWKDEDIEAILTQHGIVVVTRHGNNPEKFIFDSDLLSRHKHDITLVTNWVTNEVSSTLARRFIRRGLSVKYLIDDYIAEYIRKNNLYQGSRDQIKYLSTPNHEPMMISPQNDSQLLDNYQASISKRNLRNRNNYENEDQSMDETDASKLAQLSSTTSLSLASTTTTNTNKKDIELTESGSDDKPSRTYVNRPGGAVKIQRGDTIQRKNTVTTREKSNERQTRVRSRRKRMKTTQK